MTLDQAQEAADDKAKPTKAKKVKTAKVKTAKVKTAKVKTAKVKTAKVKTAKPARVKKVKTAKPAKPAKVQKVQKVKTAKPARVKRVKKVKVKKDKIVRERIARNFGPIRWLPRILVLLPFIYWFLYRIPSDDAAAPIAADACIYAIVGLSLNILIGYTGQLSLGHNGFFGIGAFAAAYSLTVRHVPFAATFVIAAVTGALFALLMGVVALRITGLYLALITLVFGLTLEESLFEVSSLTNAGAGQPADRPEFLFSDRNFFYFCLAFLLVALYIDYRLLKSKAGRALLALKENERVAEAFGINVTAFKLLAFVLSGSLAGIAGALLAYRIGIVTASGLGFNLALTFVLMTVVGGLGSRLGVVLGASLFASLSFLLDNTWVHGIQEFFVTILSFGNESAKTNVEGSIVAFIGALGLLLTIVLNPGGIAQQIRPITRWLAGKPFSLHDESDAGPASVEGSSVRA